MPDYKRSFRLLNRDRRGAAARQCMTAPYGVEVIFRERTRTLDQNDALWARLKDISDQLDWHGQKLTKEEWKDYFMHALKRAKWVPAEWGGMIPIGMSTSALRVSDMRDLIELINEFAARHGVVFKNE